MAPATAAEAIEQINEKGYADPWQASGKKIIKIGLVFDAEKRNVSDYDVEIG